MFLFTVYLSHILLDDVPAEAKGQKEFQPLLQNVLGPMDFSLFIMVNKKHVVRISLVLNGKHGKRLIVVVAAQYGGARVQCKQNTSEIPYL